MHLQLLRFETCPACNVAIERSQILFPVLLFGTRCDVRKCTSCGLVYKELRPAETQMPYVYSEDYVHFQPLSPPGPAEINSVKQKLRRSTSLMPGNRPPAELRVLDVGCGTGGLVRIARQLGYAAEGIDPFLPARIEDSFLRRAQLLDLSAGQFDLVLLLNVAEHVFQPRSLFSAARRALRPGGVLLVTCPYGDSMALRFHRERWTHLALDEHLLFWTRRSLARALADAGFNGPARIRVAGSPFPFGLAVAAPPRPAPAQDVAPPVEGGRSSRGVQEIVWRLARWLQRSDRVAVAVQAAIHTCRLGDYLEYAISTGEAS